MLRGVEDKDLPSMRRWRNHPRVRAASFATHKIGEDEHAQWWEATRADVRKRVLIYEHDGTPSGVVTFFGLSSESASWGFYLDLEGLEQSGELLRAWIGLERAAIDHAFGTLGLTTLRGEVLACNEAVRRLHRRFGFLEVGAYLRDVDGESRDVVAIRLVKEQS